MKETPTCKCDDRSHRFRPDRWKLKRARACDGTGTIFCIECGTEIDNVIEYGMESTWGDPTRRIWVRRKRKEIEGENNEE